MEILQRLHSDKKNPSSRLLEQQQQHLGKKNAALLQQQHLGKEGYQGHMKQPLLDEKDQGVELQQPEGRGSRLHAD